ncbi:MAG TPA: ATP-binding cassette domain-containing protein [Gammaproteobacteria bacterium]|nr:ATP-binding cassette domain-containing protein [Gammaproteobacteria bacterium]
MTAALEIRDLRMRRGERDILRGVSLAVERRQLVALMGLSGSGKSTLLRAVAALEPFDGGTIRVGAVQLAAGVWRPPSPDPLRREVGMVFQFHHLFEHLSALDNVCLAPCHVRGDEPAAARERAAALLEQLGVGHRGTARPRELSGGEAQRVAIARALAMDPPLLLLDEPTASLDPARRRALGESLAELADSGRALLVTSHDDDFVRDFADGVVILAHGEAVEAGDPRQVLDAPRHEATRALLAAKSAGE